MQVDSKAQKKYVYQIGFIMVLFLLVWFFCAKSFTGWGDEITHFATAKGLSTTGEYRIWGLDNGQVSQNLYTRGLVITYLSSLAYKLAGLSLLVFRSVPLVFVLLTFLTFAFYIRSRYRASWKALAYAAVFFFGQEFVFEQSMYVRIYAPLGWLMICGLIFYWEAYVKFQQKRILLGTLLLFASLATLILPTLDHWQMQHFAILALGILLSMPAVWQTLLKINERLSVATKLYLGLCFVFMCLFAVILLDYAMVYWVIDAKKRVMGRSFVTYWDNIAGMVRFALALNICFLGVRWVVQNLRQKKVLDFYSWLFLAGIMSGVLIGLLNPHNHIFYSRFFYISVMMSVFGFSQILLQSEYSNKFKQCVIGIFIICNLGLFAVNAYCERSNIPHAVSWLEKNLKQDEWFLVFATQLELHGGESLVNRTYPVSPNPDPEIIKKLLNHVQASQQDEIYYLYTDEYEFRDNLYFWTMRDDRSPPNDLFRHLKEKVVSEPVLAGLRTCNLVKFKKADVVSSLQKLLQDGYPPQFKGVEKRTIKAILKPLLKEKI